MNRRVHAWIVLVSLPVLLGMAPGPEPSPSAPAPSSPEPTPSPSPEPTPSPEPQPAEGSGVWVAESLGTVGGSRTLQDFAAVVSPVAGVAPGDLLGTSLETDEQGLTHLRFKQLKNGLEVVGGDFTAHADRSGNLYAVFGDARGSESTSAVPLLTVAEATEAAVAARPVDDQVVGVPRLVYLIDGGDLLRLAYEVSVTGSEAGSLIDELVYIDATSGVHLESHALAHSALNRRVYNGANTTRIPGPYLVRREGQAPVADAIVNQLYDSLGLTYQFYSVVLRRDSWNGQGGILSATVHYGSQYRDANWVNGQMIFGDGDGVNVGNLAQAFDVVVHEVTHGVTQTTAKLAYCNESGALNEATSDIMAAAATARYQGINSPDVWKIAEAVWTPSIPGDALRYMDDPVRDNWSKDWYPFRVPKVSSCTAANDFGGVHRNSGIANLAFKLMVTGGQHPRGRSPVVVQGLGLDAATRIWYHTLRYYLTSSSTFQQTRYAMSRAAVDLFGREPYSGRAVRAAWDAVGVPY